MKSNSPWDENNRSQTRPRNRKSRMDYDNDDRYIDDYHEPRRPRGRSTRGYVNEGYAQQRGFNYAWIIVPLLLFAVAALSFGIYHLMAVSKPALAQITAVTPNYTTIKKPYKSCHKEATTSYVANQKDGTNGAIIGGATGAVAGGVIGNQFKQGGGGTLIGAVVGGATGAFAGREIQRSNQPDYIAKHGSTTKCATLYKSERVKSGSYTVQYNYNQAVSTIVTRSAPVIGSSMSIAQLQMLAAN